MHAAAPGMLSSPSLVGWSAWVGWWAGRSRIDRSCHETRTVGGLTHASHTSICDRGGSEVGGG